MEDPALGNDSPSYILHCRLVFTRLSWSQDWVTLTHLIERNREETLHQNTFITTSLMPEWDLKYVEIIQVLIKIYIIYTQFSSGWLINAIIKWTWLGMTQRQPLSRMEVFTVTSSRASLESTETRPTINITAPHSAGQADTHPSEQTHTLVYNCRNHRWTNMGF